MVERLKKRRDFLAAARSMRLPRRAFVMEARRREDDGPARVGFTVSKRVSKKAVERNRIRRRLKEAVRLIAPTTALPGHDYVLVGRRTALSEPFDHITSELAGALAHPSAQAGRAPARRRTESR